MLFLEYYIESREESAIVNMNNYFLFSLLFITIIVILYKLLFISTVDWFHIF